MVSFRFLLVDFGLSQPVEETSKMVSVLPEESRKRKREKEPIEVSANGYIAS